MKYETFHFSDKNSVDEMLLSSDTSIVISAIIGMINGIDDGEWIESRLIPLIHSADFWIAKNAITGIADVARIHKKLDYNKVFQIFDQLNRLELQASIQDTINDINIFIPESKK